jgi:hypothetical protein
MVAGAATIRLADAKAGVDETREVLLLAPIGDQAVSLSWEEAAPVDLAVTDLATSPREPAQYADVPAAAGRAKSYEGWTRDLVTWLQGSQRLDLFRHGASKAISRPGESEREFRVRLQEGAREERDRAAERLRQKYGPKRAALEDRLRRAQQALAREQEQVGQQGLQTAISVGASILGAFLGRKVTNVSNVGRATTAARGAGRVLKERQDVGRAQEAAQAVQQRLADLEARFQAELAEAGAGGASPDALDPIAIRPKKGQVTVRLLSLAWAPHWRQGTGAVTPAWT